ncbi:Uncharacterized protein HZ326_28203 [Fusarium oxysporum f. sp. albedinis]|nr:Uncharacterized protein HZ326_28203 [Fusarium oxysporum f. sp. albedinis]
MEVMGLDLVRVKPIECIFIEFASERLPFWRGKGVASSWIIRAWGKEGGFPLPTVRTARNYLDSCCETDLPFHSMMGPFSQSISSR